MNPQLLSILLCYNMTDGIAVVELSTMQFVDIQIQRFMTQPYLESSALLPKHQINILFFTKTANTQHISLTENTLCPKTKSTFLFFK